MRLRLRHRFAFVALGQLSPNARLAKLFADVHRNVGDGAIRISELDSLFRLVGLLVGLIFRRLRELGLEKLFKVCHNPICVSLREILCWKRLKTEKPKKHANEKCAWNNVEFSWFYSNNSFLSNPFRHHLIPQFTKENFTKISSCLSHLLFFSILLSTNEGSRSYLKASADAPFCYRLIFNFSHECDS